MSLLHDLHYVFAKFSRGQRNCNLLLLVDRSQLHSPFLCIPSIMSKASLCKVGRPFRYSYSFESSLHTPLVRRYIFTMFHSSLP